jgi:UDP-glucose 4-epimerase
MSARRALVTGAGGFVCRHIVDALLARGWRVIALDRAYDAALQARWDKRVEMIVGDAARLPDLPVHALVYGAAITASPEEAGIPPEAYLRAHLDAALDALTWAETFGARALLLTSDAVFMQTPLGLLDEDTPTQPHGVYAIAKATLESLATTLRDDNGRDVVAARLGSIYGPGELPRPSRPRLSRVARMIHEALTEGQMRVDTRLPTRSWTYAPDVGAAIAALLETPTLHDALFNVASEETLRLTEIAHAIQPHFPHARIVPDDGEPLLDQRHHTLANKRLRHQTGFDAWTPFVDGISATIEWQRAQAQTEVAS